jgi:hypothetical protein
MRTSEYNRLIKYAAKEIEEWITEQRYLLPEEKYLALLCNFQKLTGAQ